MVDNLYKNAFKEIYIILQNTEDELVQKVPQKFMDFLQNNMNSDYEVNIDNNTDINKQSLLPETEAVLSLIYRSYWATDEEKAEFSNNDIEHLAKVEKIKKSQYKDIDEIFSKRQNLDNVSLDSSLMIIPKEKFFKKVLRKIFNFLKINI